MSLPDYNFLSAPLWLITALHILTLTLHFVAMNFLVGGLVIILWGKFQRRWEDPTVQKFLALFPTAMAATVTLGVAPLLFVQLVFHRQVYSAAIVSGWFWLGIVCAVVAGYYFLYGAASPRTTSASRRKLYLTVALAMFLYVSIVYSSVFSMAERPELIGSLYTQGQSGLLLNPIIGDYLWRWLHMILGALTVGGFFVGLLGKENPEAFRIGKVFFLWGMVLASVAGLGYMFSLSESLVPFMRSPGIWMVTVGAFLSAGSLHFFFRRQFLMSGLMLFVSLLSMVMTRHFLRLVKLGAEFEPSTLRVAPQWSVFILFVIFLVIAAAAVIYMLKLFFGSNRASSR